MTIEVDIILFQRGLLLLVENIHILGKQYCVFLLFSITLLCCRCSSIQFNQHIKSQIAQIEKKKRRQMLYIDNGFYF